MQLLVKIVIHETASLQVFGKANGYTRQEVKLDK